MLFFKLAVPLLLRMVMNFGCHLCNSKVIARPFGKRGNECMLQVDGDQVAKERLDSTLMQLVPVKQNWFRAKHETNMTVKDNNVVFICPHSLGEQRKWHRNDRYRNRNLRKDHSIWAVWVCGRRWYYGGGTFHASVEEANLVQCSQSQNLVQGIC